MKLDSLPATLLNDMTRTPGEGARFSGKMESLPGYLRFARQRLAYVCLVYAIMWIAAFAAHNVLHSIPEQSGLFVGIFVSALVLALGVFGLSRSSIDTRLLLDIALWFEVVGAFLIASIEVLSIRIPDARIIGISNVCVLVAVFPFFVPATLGKSMLASITAASMGPFAYLIYAALGYEAPPVSQLLSLYTPNYLAAGISFFPIYLLNKDRSDLDNMRRMGSYELLERLGQGGMGEVWRAKHDMLARQAVIKLVKLDASGSSNQDDSERAKKRFQREAQVTSALESPHTVKLYDFGTTNTGSLYYVMELLSGINLEQLVDRFGPIPAARAAYILKQVCLSLAEAHQHQLIHRDIKPANILICRLGTQYDFGKVLDFGLVKNRTLAGSQSKLTADGLITGTPAYLAPEQVTQNQIDERADLYSLGCVAYWLITSQLVFDNSNQMKVVMDHVQTQPVPPTKRCEMPIPTCLEEIVMTCLQKDPDKRPQSAQTLYEQLSHCHFDEGWDERKAQHWWELHLPEHKNRPLEYADQNGPD